MDHPVLSGSEIPEAWVESKLNLGWLLEQLKEVAIETNKEYAKKLGINISAAITAVN